MKNHGPIGAASICLLLSACSQSTALSAADPAKVTAEVKAVVHTQVDAYAARDAEKAASILSPDMIGMFHGEPTLVGAEASLGQIKAQMSDPALKLSVSDEAVDVAIAGDMAVYRATYNFTYTNPETNKPTTEIGKWVAVFVRQPDGTMKMSRDMIIDTPA